MKKILLIGKNGMLGNELYESLKNDYEVIATTRNDLDICNKEQVKEIIEKISPNIVINCAAYTNVDGCEKNFEIANNINGIAVENIAVATKNINAILIHISTDYVFDGSLDINFAYTEDMKPNPISAYGKTKLLGEENAKKANKYYILRTAWLYGNGKNFVRTMLELSNTKDQIKVVCDQNGSPTSIKSLCSIINKIIEKKPVYGIYNATNEGYTSWYEFAEKIMKIAKKDTRIIPITSEEYQNMYPESTKRPYNSKLSLKKLNSVGIYPNNYEKELIEYLKININ